MVRLGDRGTLLSGGQQQRIGIARAVLIDPAVLVLDEATSSLDTVTETAIQRAIDEMARDRTVIAIAHRLSTIRHADQIVVLDAGRMVEEGSYSELLAQRGAFWRMVEQQRMQTSGEARVAPEVEL